MNDFSALSTVTDGLRTGIRDFALEGIYTYYCKIGVSRQNLLKNNTFIFMISKSPPALFKINFFLGSSNSGSSNSSESNTELELGEVGFSIANKRGNNVSTDKIQLNLFPAFTS